MSEEILKALTQLYAILCKQDGGVLETERAFVINYFKKELDQDSVKEYVGIFDDLTSQQNNKGKEKKLTSVKDSVRTLGICKKINKTLTQKQKIVVLFKLMELINSNSRGKPQQFDILETVSEVFNFDKNEYKLIEKFVFTDKEGFSCLDQANLLILRNESLKNKQEALYLHSDISGVLAFIKVKSVDMYFLKYMGEEEMVLNGFVIQANSIYNFSSGSTIKTPGTEVLFYSDIISHFNNELQTSKLSFEATDLYYKFANGEPGLRGIDLFENQGKLVGIMGASGAGKTTLLNVLAGISKPSSGQVLLNGINIHTEKEKVKGSIGYVSQDDILMEELTVFENLYYNARLCFAHLDEKAIEKKVMEVLESLGLEKRKDLKVGSVLDKTISGGQRKRLNIALELIRQPTVLFVDEPTSGLSSKDSENVMDLLKELSLKGKLIFVVIHQPSSDIYKLFDKMFILDTGGYPIFYGNPVQSVVYFKEITNQVDKNKGQCPECGNVTPEQIFNIVEAKVVDEYGQLTNKRKITPEQWGKLYREKNKPELVRGETSPLPDLLKIPSKIKQCLIFTVRDFISKIRNRQYVIINLLESPSLAIILALVIKYNNTTDGKYEFSNNENIPAFIMMSVVVSLFMGLSVSAEEIIRDRKILKRESFLNLSWASYLSSKLIILFALSAVQTLSFVIIGNWILEIRGMFVGFWLALFAVSCFANVIGLNISSAFNSAITVYILIPIILIPQMILSGLMFSFDKLNELISSQDKVPVVADLMVSRWALEAMMVEQYKDNGYQYLFYNLEKEASNADFKTAFLIPYLKKKAEFVFENLPTANDSIKTKVKSDLITLRNSLAEEPDKFNGNILFNALVSEDPQAVKISLTNYFEDLENKYNGLYNRTLGKKEKLIDFLAHSKRGLSLSQYRNKYFNQSISDVVRNVNTSDRIIEVNNRVIQKSDPIFNDPKPSGFLDYRTHFYAPEKYFLGQYFDTFSFNVIVIWVMSFVFSITLYFESLKKTLNFWSKIKFR